MAEGRGREHAPQQVERLGADRAPPGALRLLGPRPALRRPRLNRLEAAGVDPEQLVHGGLVGLAQLLVAVVAVAAALLHRLVVGDVARRLLQVGGQPAALEDLGEDVRDPLAGQVGASHLADRVVAVADEHPLVEPRRPLALDAVEGTMALGHVGGELLEEQPPHRARVARVAGEHRPLHRLGQVDQAEDRPVEVGEVGTQDRLLLGGERLDRIAHEVDPSQRRGGPAGGSRYGGALAPKQACKGAAGARKSFRTPARPRRPRSRSRSTRPPRRRRSAGRARRRG